MYVIKVPRSNSQVNEIVKDPNGYVEETRLRSRKRAATTRRVLLQQVKKAKP